MPSALSKQGSESSREPLGRRILKDESLRVRIQAAEMFVERGWTLPGGEEFSKLPECLPEGFSIEKKTGKLRRS